MRCRLESKSRCDENFQIEFNDLKEIKELKDSLSAMIQYIELCREDNTEEPELIYRITNLNNNEEKK